MSEDVIWRDIAGYEGYYIISNTGVIMSLRYRWGVRPEKKIISQCLTGGYHNTFYWGVNFYKDTVFKRYLVHRLLAIAFIPNPDNKEHVNHIDLNPLNNSLSNLEWVTRRENISHYFKSQTSKPIGATYSSKNRGKKWVSKISVKNKTVTLGYFNSEEEAGQAYKNALLELNEINCYA